MPLKKGSQKTISKNIETELKSYKKTGKLGTSKPKNKKAAAKQAAAIAYSKAGKSRKKDQSEEVMEDSVNISKFVENIILKNYSEADKYLKAVINNKLQQKIATELSTPLF
jgi:hypothetical protein